MTDEQTLDRLIAHLRAQVAELRRREQAGAAPDEVAERTRLIMRLQEQLAYVVRDLLRGQAPHSARARSNGAGSDRSIPTPGEAGQAQPSPCRQSQASGCWVSKVRIATF
jgi:hypothetical protein